VITGSVFSIVQIECLSNLQLGSLGRAVSSRCEVQTNKSRLQTHFGHRRAQKAHLVNTNTGIMISSVSLHKYAFGV